MPVQPNRHTIHDRAALRRHRRCVLLLCLPFSATTADGREHRLSRPGVRPLAVRARQLANEVPGGGEGPGRGGGVAETRERRLTGWAGDEEGDGAGDGGGADGAGPGRWQPSAVVGGGQPPPPPTPPHVLVESVRAAVECVLPRLAVVPRAAVLRDTLRQRALVHKPCGEAGVDAVEPVGVDAFGVCEAGKMGQTV